MILLIGYGASGKAAERLARALGHDVDIRADASEASLDHDYAFAVISPGVPLTAPLVETARARGIALKSELQFGCEELTRRGWKLLAVTGSKGKSSVVRLCAEALGGVPCGNYGWPVCDLFDARPGWAVVEVSSFQLETTELPAGTFEAAAILNLQEDHLDRHGSVAVYHALKRKLLTFAKVPLDGTQMSAQEGVRTLFVGSYFDRSVLADNACCAVALLRAAGLSDARISAAFAAFRPLPHRFETVGTFRGVRYVDDSKATSLAALGAAVRMAGGRVRLIAGGLPKGDDPASVCPDLTAFVKKVYLIGQSASAFDAVWKRVVATEICGTLDRAVASAMREAETGDIVLLSPGTASFDQFRNFGERGEIFASLVKREGLKK